MTSAYRIPANGGAGATIAVVDADGYPTAEADLAVYRAQFGLPACTTANGCFRKVDQGGGTSYPPSNADWAGETALDLDMVSAIAPAAHIVLVEAYSNAMTDLGASVNTAVALGAKYVSNSYGTGESAAETPLDADYNHPGVAVVASSGDKGYATQYPASSPYVTAVGGTSLTQSSDSARGWSETTWSGSGSGCSTIEPKPSWQTDTGCAMRSAADVSAVADPGTGVALYDSFSSPGWLVAGGTSVAAPIIAAVYAVAGTPAAGSYPASYAYSRTFALNDITTGSNGSCSPAYLCTAGPGYDGPTGLGSPAGTAAFTQGRVVSLRAHANNDYVTADNAGASPLIANRTAIGGWEQFDLIDLGGGNIALLSHADNDYVTAENAGASPLIANRTAIGGWETFQLINNADGSISLKAAADDEYVTADNYGNSPLIANRTAIGGWEEFDLIG
ncbi:peptidase S8 [Catenulispora sp. NF23]|uniref:Peptidase S8 n=1 Tax=Catenulispora pinistramenti TaxID=2705254 RepID=A0ABS5L581_9ACTN|nr:peptidase S8 [Catenulispora pinistramenti]MBS2539792.1 peptidase S8 [Catenulispora pinistramenti]MBS2553512.1 peptidase S8 [Catenulispora pinistramenti]